MYKLIPAKSTEPDPALEASRAVHRKKYVTLPRPRRSQEMLSNSTASAAVTAMAGSPINRKGEKSGHSRR